MLTGLITFGLVAFVIIEIIWIRRVSRQFHLLQCEFHRLQEMISGNVGKILADPNAPESLKEWAQGILETCVKSEPGQKPPGPSSPLPESPEVSEPSQDCCGNSDWPCGGPRV
jgi:hypothetical protein